MDCSASKAIQSKKDPQRTARYYLCRWSGWP